MKPDKDGIWEWFEEDGTKRLVHVCNVAAKLGEVRLRVAWWGGYYDVHDRIEDTYKSGTGGKWVVAEKDVHYEAEWPDRWGKYVGPSESVNRDDIYEIPTPEQREDILKNYKLKQL